jgi:hypothetical protein
MLEFQYVGLWYVVYTPCSCEWCPVCCAMVQCSSSVPHVQATSSYHMQSACYASLAHHWWFTWIHTHKTLTVDTNALHACSCFCCHCHAATTLCNSVLYIAEQALKMTLHRYHELYIHISYIRKGTAQTPNHCWLFYGFRMHYNTQTPVFDCKPKQ